MSDPLDLVPTESRPAVRSALAAAFGRSPVGALRPVTQGASARSYRLEVAGRSYLLRLESARRDEVRDPQRSYPCMLAAADAGIAPRVRYADPAAGVAISDFVSARPLPGLGAQQADLLRDLGTLVARLQAMPAFPPVLSYPTLLGRLLDRLLASGLFAPGLLDRHRDGLERIRRHYPWEATSLVASHNDLNPTNVLFDGKQLWLVDWETAYGNDPLVDVATLLTFFADQPGLENALLVAWLGRSPDPLVRARLGLMRQMVRLFLGCAASLNAAAASTTIVPETDLSAPTAAQFRDDVARGRQSVGTPQAQRMIGKIALAGFLAGLASPQFEEALVVVAHG